MATRVINIHDGQPYDVYCGRPGQWGNPFALERPSDRHAIIKVYTRWLLEQPELLAAIPIELKDKILGCYCVPRLCHAQMLARVADEGVESIRRWLIFMDQVS